MRLLTPQEQKNAEQEEDQKKRRKTAENNEALTKIVKELNEFREKSRIERERIANEYDNFLAELSAKEFDLNKKVEALEKRVDKGLIPLRKEEERIDRKQKDLELEQERLDKRERELDVRQEDIRELADSYKKRLGELADFKEELRVEKQKFEEERAQYNNMMRYRETAVQNDRKKLRTYFEEESRKLDQLKLKK